MGRGRDSNSIKKSLREIHFNLVYNSHDLLKIKDSLNTGIQRSLHHAKHII